jgi:uncharacterized BrkB/YihY/UPF0761 family membrane protein
VRFTIWFFVLTGAVGLVVVASEQLRSAGLAALVPAWLVGSMAFWLWTPRFLLPRAIPIRSLLPGAILATIVIGGATATSPLFLGDWMNSNGKYFGSFGVVIALLGWAFILFTLSLVCIVFSPVWGEWRESERQRAASGGPTAPEAAAPPDPAAP